MPFAEILPSVDQVNSTVRPHHILVAITKEEQHATITTTPTTTDDDLDNDFDLKKRKKHNFDEKKTPLPLFTEVASFTNSTPPPPPPSHPFSIRNALSKEGFRAAAHVLIKFAKFTGPGAIISVAYVDPDNFQTAALAVKLGSVTGLNLAEMNRAYLPRWLNWALYAIAEAAIICTDIGQVIGTAIALNILSPRIPLVAGCAIAIGDCLFILAFYRSDGSLRRLRVFELFVTAFVLGVFISFIIELTKIRANVGHVFKGYLPSREVFVGQG
ncbi:hypothetical protein B7463_g10190, partial [Scytalidium lignicola]